jgi:hypothetical protein
VLLTRLPLTPKGPFDLHVLSLPPAFVLSQDQTLKFKEFNLDCVTTQIDRAPLTPAFPPERCTHQKHRSGRCLSSNPVGSPSDQRSPARTPPPTLLSLVFTCQRARRLSQDAKRTDITPAGQTGRGDRLSRKPNRARHSDSAVDEPDISSPEPPVNPARKEILGVQVFSLRGVGPRGPSSARPASSTQWPAADE